MALEAVPLSMIVWVCLERIGTNSSSFIVLFEYYLRAEIL